MVAVSEAGKVPSACDGNLVGNLCSFCLLRRDRTLWPIEVLYEAVLRRRWIWQSQTWSRGLAHVAPSTALVVVKVSVASRPGGTLTASLTATT